MKKPFYVRFDVPKELVQQAYEILSIAKRTGKIKTGVSETTIAIEREIAKLVYIPEDIEPPELVAHLPSLCDDKKIPFVYVPDRSTLKEYCKVQYPTASACIVDLGEAYKMYKELVEKIEKISK